MTFRILFLTLIFYAGQALTSELTVYRWIDKKNVVHFSQHQPVGDEYTQFIISNQSKIISRADLNKTELPSTDITLPSSQKTQVQVATIDVSKKCQEAKENVSMLIAFEKVQYTDENGDKKYSPSKRNNSN